MIDHVLDCSPFNFEAFLLAWGESQYEFAMMEFESVVIQAAVIFSCRKVFYK